MKMILSKREKRLIAVAAVFFLFMLYWLAYLRPYQESASALDVEIGQTLDTIELRTTQARSVVTMDEDILRLDEVQKQKRRRVPYQLDNLEISLFLDDVLPSRLNTEFLETQPQTQPAPFREIWVSVRTIAPYEQIEEALRQLRDGQYMCKVESYEFALAEGGVDATITIRFLTHDDPAWDTPKAPHVPEIPSGKINPFE